MRARGAVLLEPTAAGVWWSALAVLMLVGPVLGRAEVVNPDQWGVDGTVVTMARAGNTLYVGGSFGSVGHSVGGGVPLRASNAQAEAFFPEIAGSVHAVVPDGRGGWFIGGEFTSVGGLPRVDLAHILADGTVADWNPGVGGNGGYMAPPAVITMVVDRGTVYVGGGFQSIGGVPRQNIGAVDAETGAVLPWAPDANWWVWALATDGRTVYAGGVFTRIGGADRRRIAALDANTGIATAWNPAPDDAVSALALGHHVVYVGGYFSRIGGQPRGLLAAIDPASGEATAWDAHVSGPSNEATSSGPYVAHLELRGGTLYVGGSFDRIGGAQRTGLAAVDVGSAVATDWNPVLGPTYGGYTVPPVWAIEIHGGKVYIGGGFTSVGGQPREYLACVDATSGEPTEWNPGFSGGAFAISASGGDVYVGGASGMLGERPRRAGLAAFDATTGALKPWNPNPDGSIVTALAVQDGTVYVSGDFGSIGGQPRRYLAALDTVTGNATEWNPGANSEALTLLVKDDVVYAGGYFTAIGGQRRRYVAALDRVTGAATAWNPDADYHVYALAASDSTMYLGGFFDYVGGQPRSQIAEVSIATGTPTTWAPRLEGGGWVNALLVHVGQVFVGGSFDRAGGEARNGLAALDATTGLATSFDARPVAWEHAYPEVMAMAIKDSTLCVGGQFSAVGDQPRLCFGTVDVRTGAATAWDPGADGYVWSLASYDRTLYAGGGFSRLGGWPCANLATITDGLPDVEQARRFQPFDVPFALAPIHPNPVHSETMLRFSLAAAAFVDLEVFDLQGRRVAIVLRQQASAAGPHEVAIRTDGWREGFYFCRLASGGLSATRKMLVLR